MPSKEHGDTSDDPAVEPIRLRQAGDPKRLIKISTTIDRDVMVRVRQLAYRQHVSETAIVEAALSALFSCGDEHSLGIMLQKMGATLRHD